MPAADSVHLLLSTCPDADSARAIARALVEEGLAACVTQLPGAHSVYRWHGAVETAEEVQLLIKTRGERLQAAIARLNELHPYDLPEALAIDASAGLPAYLDWVRAQTSEDV
ncbi:MAG TPA: divalent-cation tolerance protein CutA [Stenotrophomonas sp.]|nr:divalent-cation tolerance protein CutA [Stenotrophomonas sp.]